MEWYWLGCHIGQFGVRVVGWGGGKLVLLYRIRYGKEMEYLKCNSGPAVCEIIQYWFVWGTLITLYVFVSYSFSRVLRVSQARLPTELHRFNIWIPLCLPLWYCKRKLIFSIPVDKQLQGRDLYSMLLSVTWN